MILLTDDKINSYRVYKSNMVVENKQQFIWACDRVKSRFDVHFRSNQTTFEYRNYNFFGLGAGFPVIYDLFEELRGVIRERMGTNERLWFQSWLNFHTPEGVLRRHNHVDCSCHGYVSIEPHNTRTVFDNYQIKNEVGLIYIGDSLKHHEVVVDELFSTKRITIAFDVTKESDFINLFNKFGDDINVSYLPLL